VRLQPGVTLLGDDAADQLQGDGGADYFLGDIDGLNANDVLLDRQDDEAADSLIT
jgi:hypothetical protein